MKTLTSVICATMLVTGCGFMPIVRTKVVTVNKPVLVIPTPPKVPKVEYEVDKLTPEDAKQPGKVGQAYVHDMTYLRAVVPIYESILAQYAASSVEFSDVNKKIQELYSQIDTQPLTDPKPSNTPANQ